MSTSPVPGCFKRARTARLSGASPSEVTGVVLSVQMAARFGEEALDRLVN